MSLINVRNLTFAYEGSYDNIFENVNFQIDTAWRLGFTGRNGRGKTTFLNLLRKKYEYEGSISSSVNFEYFPYEIEEKEAFSIEVIREIALDAMDWQITRELSLLDMDDNILYRQFNTLSKGEQTKVMLVAMFLKENSFLLIDEPTNHLDMEGRKKLSEYLKKKSGFILISHDRSFLDNCIDHILSINKTNIEIQKGNFTTWWENKKMQDEFERCENEKLKKDIKKLSEAARRTSNWSDKVEKTKIGSKGDKGRIGHLAAKMMKRSKSLENRRNIALEKKTKLLKNIENADRLKLSPELSYYKDELVELQKVSIFYQEHMVCKDVQFSIRQGERINLKGKNGSGKSSILKLICGEDISYKGSFRKGSNIKISYVSQDTSYLKGSLTNYASETGIDETIFKAMLRKLDFSRLQFEKDMSLFSEGQKKKVIIAKSLCEEAHLYVWDEPLNFVDVISRMQIEKLLKEQCKTLLFVEHDSEFCNNVATKCYEL